MKNTSKGSDMKIRLIEDYYLEIIETIPDAKGNNLMGYLYKGSVLLDEVIESKLFKTKESLSVYFMKTVLPNYIREHQDSLGDLVNKSNIEAFVSSYISNNRITYGSTIDVLSVLKDDGYEEPDTTKPGFSMSEYLAYHSMVTIVSLELVNQLKRLNFVPDRSNSFRAHHSNIPKHAESMNLVFTRFPWGVMLKADKAMKTVRNLVKYDYLKDINLTHLSKKSPLLVKKMKAVSKQLNSDSHNISEILNDGFNDKYEDFSKVLKVEERRLVDYYKEVCPYEK